MGTDRRTDGQTDRRTDGQTQVTTITLRPKRPRVKNTKAPRHWPLCGEFTRDRWIPRTNGQLRGKCFHLMTSSCSWCVRHILIYTQQTYNEWPLSSRAKFFCRAKSNHQALTRCPPERCGSNFTIVFFKIISLVIDICSTSNEMVLRLVPENPIDDKSKYGEVMSWCHKQAIP